MCKTNSDTSNLIKHFDVVVDGKFDEDKKSPRLKFRGSSNQRILDAQQTIKQNKPVERYDLYEKYEV